MHLGRGKTKGSQSLGGLNPDEGLDGLSKQVSLVHCWIGDLKGLLVQGIVNRCCGTHDFLTHLE